MTFEVGLKLVGAVGGAVAVARATGAAVKHFVRKVRDGADRRYYLAIVEAQQKSPATICWQPLAGSRDHDAAERLVTKGLLRRERLGGTPAYELA